MLKKISKYLLVFLLLMIILLLILIASNCIPHRYIKDNVEKSIDTFLEESYYPKVKYAYKFVLDNYTDALMVATAYSIDEKEPLVSTILMRRYYIPGDNQILQDPDSNDKPIDYLYNTINNTNETYTEYSRYWHGYIIFLRPLLMFFNYSQIRIIMMIAVDILSLLLIVLIYKKLGKYYTIPILILLILSQFWAIGLSLLYTPVFLIMLCVSNYILITNKNIKDINIVFLTIGMLTSFLDLLTAPILTLGIPLLIYCILNNKDNTIKNILEIILVWFIGYVGMWVGKWILSDIICNTKTIENALGKVFLYTRETKYVNISFIHALCNNFKYIAISLTILVLTTIISLIYMVKTKTINQQILVYMLIAIIPLLWLSFAKNHSYIHARFTFRNLLVTEFAMLEIGTVLFFKFQKKGRNND